MLSQVIQWLEQPPKTPLKMSYLSIRKYVGIIGLALPFVLFFGEMAFAHKIHDSLSAYYYGVVRDIFVGSLCAIGVFLICYRYERIDDIVSWAGGIAAIGVALFPTTPDTGATQLQITIGVVLQKFLSSSNENIFSNRIQAKQVKDVPVVSS